MSETRKDEATDILLLGLVEWLRVNHADAAARYTPAIHAALRSLAAPAVDGDEVRDNSLSREAGMVARNYVPENNSGYDCGVGPALLTLADRVALVEAGVALSRSRPAVPAEASVEDAWRALDRAVCRDARFSGDERVKRLMGPLADALAHLSERAQ